MNVEEEVKALKEEVEALRGAFNTFKGAHFTPDNYLRYESLPQLVGGVTHSAGSEEVLAGDRWEAQAPTFYQVLQVDAGGQTVEILNQTETGRLVTVGVGISKYTLSGGSADVFLDITIDGGTTRSFQLAFNGTAAWGRIWDPYVTKRGATGTGQSGGTLGDGLLLHFNLAYETSILLEARVANVSTFTGEWDWTFSVVRGVLT